MCRARGIASRLARPPHPQPQPHDRPTACFHTPASFQTPLRPTARDLSRTSAIDGLPTPEGYWGDEAASGARAWLPGTPPLRLPFTLPFPGPDCRRAARHSNGGSVGLQAGARRERAPRTRSRPHCQPPDCTSAPHSPSPPLRGSPWVPVGPSRPRRAYPNLPPTAPPSWRRTEGALLPRGGPRARGPARVDA